MSALGCPRERSGENSGKRELEKTNLRDGERAGKNAEKRSAAMKLVSCNVDGFSIRARDA